MNLDSLNDRQKIWLSQISYLNVNSEGRNKISNGGLNISELKNYLSNPKSPFVGDAMLGEKKFNSLASSVTGNEKIPTQEDVVDSLISAGLGDLKIINITEEQKFSSSGFQALTFEDLNGNTGISYRGSDFEFSKGGARDWLEADMLEYFKNDSTQRKEALEYFNKNKNQNGNNYVYGHSLGGNLTSHVLVENCDEVKQAFTINGNPINQKLLDTPEKIETFNNPEKYSCNIICGDIVGNLKSCELYEKNINYIKNNDTMKTNFVSAHLVQAATFDQDGNFVKTTKEEMKEKMGLVSDSFTSFVQKVREVMNEFEVKMSNMKESFNEYKKSLFNSFKKKYDEFGIEDNTVTKENFQSAARKAEMEEIEKVKSKLIANHLEENSTYQENQSKTR